ncbi:MULTISPECIES: FAD-dependent monooxygenase [Streptomyces]|uniref:FAD-dependent monooxygenase n=1 Tax=Streptomyces TaxID=1883 RepID=UPI0022492C67|nr:FAD-dependent monooxygenase [Streptomyces sp. JHD 1]MCX2971366.1 FAD-dependent monooxygenase [Streptomyces sp. JHD 1]
MEPVIVVGAGPVGLALALALARHEVPSVLLDGGDGTAVPRPARTCVLRPDTAALAQRLAGAAELSGTHWRVWRTLRRRQTVHQVDFAPGAAPFHLAQHTLTAALADAARRSELIEVVPGQRLTELEQLPGGVRARTAGGPGATWSGSYLVGCDGARSTVRKLLGVRFPGRTSVERRAVATVRTALPWPQEALLHRDLPGVGGEVSARSLPGDRWRLDWRLPPRGDLVTPDALIDRVQRTLSAWSDAAPGAYELLDTGVHTAHQRIARHWRAGRAFLAGDAARLLGALGTQSVEEGLRDADNLAWKLALVWRGTAPEALLDSYEAERRGASVARLRALDQALPLVQGGGALRSLLPGGRGPLGLLTDGHVGTGPLGAPGAYSRSPLTPGRAVAGIGTAPGAVVDDVPVTPPGGARQRLRQRLGRGLLVVLVAPGAGVWESRHWMHAGVMPRLAAAVRGLPLPAELLVAEAYPGAVAHTCLLVRPDGHLAAALPGVDPDALHACATAVAALDAPDPDADADPAPSQAPDTSNATAADGAGDTVGARRPPPD